MQDRGDLGEESALVEACRQGNVRAFEKLYKAHGVRMKSLAANLLGNASDAEDAVQEAFIRIYRGVRGFRGQSSFSTWIFRILVNACHDVARKRLQRAREEGVPLEDGCWPGARSTDHPLRMALEESLGKLRPRNRQAFVLFEVEGFKHREIAEILEISEANSKQLVFAARRELRNLLQGRAES